MKTLLTILALYLSDEMATMVHDIISSQTDAYVNSLYTKTCTRDL